MRKLDCPIGQRLGGVLVTGEGESWFDGTRDRRRWSVKCDCGEIFLANASKVWNGRCVSCAGCTSRSLSALRTKHGLVNAPEYNVWNSMRSRCFTKTNAAYHHYGGRGISVCKRWDDFGRFYADMGPRPSPDHWIERVDNDGDYEPGNCVWALPRDQSRNKRSSHLLTIDGRTQTVTAWAEESGLPIGTFRERIRTGVAPEVAFSKPSHTAQVLRPANDGRLRRRSNG